MSTKDLFDKGYSLKFLKNQSQESLREDLESSRYLQAYSKKRQRFLPDTDFTTASNFARFGLAEEYYDTAIKRIYQAYPYDGSLAEKTEWENHSTYLDLFLFENEYPRTNGFVTINSGSSTRTSAYSAAHGFKAHYYSSSLPQYIVLYGGPHADSNNDYKSELSAGPSKKGISKANIYHTGSQRTNNLELDPSKGITIEFWMKKDGWESTLDIKSECIFNLISSGATGDNYGNLQVFIAGYEGVGAVAMGLSKSTIMLDITSGSFMDYHHLQTGLTDIADGEWHHYAITLKTKDNVPNSNLYVDGIHQSAYTASATDGYVTGAISGKMMATLGAIAGPTNLHSGYPTENNIGWGNIVSCSLDEFRYWKTERNAQQIGRYYRDQVGGGTNTDNIKYDDVTNKVDLGVYYKFNEGIIGNSAIDTTILDYSGRISNGEYVNYSSGCRNTGSAIVLAGAASREFKDPILYSTHPSVASLIKEKKLLGKMHDDSNLVSLYKSVPGWILEEDERESNHLKYLMQILASYFDDLYLQIEGLSKLKDINYPDDTNYEKPLPFADQLLETRGYDAPELFAHANALAQYLERDEKRLFEKKLYEVKNIIYQNIYNNLSYIQKSKGTYKSLRNFLRCFGVDEELIKLNIYANNDVYELKDNSTNIALRKKFIDFDDPETRYAASGKTSYSGSFTATAYQYKDSSINNAISYIPAISANQVTGAALTIEAEVIVPKRAISGDQNYKLYPSLTSSIFGIHAVLESDSDLSFAADDTINFNVVINKSNLDLRNGYFSLLTSGSSNILSDVQSNNYIGLYDNQKWNLAFRLRPSGYPNPAPVPSSSATYTYELYGNNYMSDILQNEFSVSGTISLANAAKFFTQPKRIFLGAARTNFTGSTVERYSDVKVSSVRAWYSYLDNETMRNHGKFSNTYGALHPLKNANLTDKTNFLGTKIPQIKTLLLNWNMDNLTGSDGNGRFIINDFSSGSSDTSSYGFLTPVIEKNYTGRGDFFESAEPYRDQAVDVEFVQTAKQKLPEVVNSDDMVKILNKQDDVVFTRETTYIQHLLSVEKSMYQTISEEMMRFFASVTDFNNLIGEPVNRYRPNYKKLEKVRELFFSRVESDLDLEKFIEYYKWIDDAITIMIAQLIPASANTVELLRNMVESHVLERNKYWTKFPTLESEPHNPISSIKGIEELKYNWKFGHAPVDPSQNTNQNKNCLWWKQRAERSDALSSSDAAANADKDNFLKIIVTEVGDEDITLKTPAGTKYIKSYYPNRSLARPWDLVSDISLQLKAGSNPKHANKHDLYKSIIKWGSDDDFIFIDADNETPKPDCNDELIPDEINKKLFKVRTLTMPANVLSNSDATGAGSNDQNYDDAKSALLLPFSMYSSSIDTGYRQMYVTGSMPKIEFANMHDDKYGYDLEVPMQGPFTEKYVGGMQHRHVKVNRGTDGQLTRPEGWHLQEFLDPTAGELAAAVRYILYESFDNASTTPTTNTSILSLPSGSVFGDPSPHEYWRNGSATDNQWTILDGPTPSAGTGPSTSPSPHATGYVYCEVLPSKVGQTFGFVSPIIDLLDYDSDGVVAFQFQYHMYGVHCGSLKIQASPDPAFQTDVEDLLVSWNAFGPSKFFSTVISGQQQLSEAESWDYAIVSSNNYSNGGYALDKYLGKRFYIRLFYTAGISHLSDIAISHIQFKAGVGVAATARRNSFKLLNPTYDNHHRPSAIYTRQEFAKRPVNIRNIRMTGSSPTVAGNFLDIYEYISTVSPEANDPFFVRNTDKIAASQEHWMLHKIEDLLNTPPGAARTALGHKNYRLPDRSYITGTFNDTTGKWTTGTVKNRARIMSRFTAHSGFESVSRGYLDPAHETYSVYNVITYRNRSSRMVYNTQLQAHQGKFGVSTHDLTAHLAGTGFARVFGSETSGAINSTDYTITGDAAKHKYHRNNIERLVLSASAPFVSDFAAGLNGSNQYFQISDHVSLSFGADGTAGNEPAFSISAWINMTDATYFPIVVKSEYNTKYEYSFQTTSADKLELRTWDGGTSKAEAVLSDNAITSHQGAWIHVVGTADADGDSDGATPKTMKLYINGQEIASTRSDLGDYTAMHNTTANLLIGKFEWSVDQYAEGAIDEVSIWGTELTAAEVLELYHGGPGPKLYSPPAPGDLAKHSQYTNLVSWWRLGDTGDTVSSGIISTSVDRKGSNNAAGQNSPTAVAGPGPSYGDTILTASLYDNAFVSHMIPRTEKQYAWITGSII